MSGSDLVAGAREQDHRHESGQHDRERGEQQRAGTIDTRPVREVVAVRTLTAFRRRHGILPQPAGKRLEELVALTREER